MKNNSKTKYNFLHNRRQEIIICLFLIASSLFVYGQIINHEFINYDDGLYVTENSNVQAGFTWEGIKWAFTTFYAGNWHPLTWLSHMLDIELYGLNPMGHHWTNLLFHMANTLLLFFIFQTMTGAIWRSAFVAVLFALHPLHIESVAWVAERKDVLSTFFGMLTISAYIIYVKKRNLLRYSLVFIFLSLGLMSKPMLVTLPFVLLLLDFWPLERLKDYSPDQSSKLLSLIYEKIAFLVPIVISSVLTIFAQQGSEAFQSLELISIKYRMANALIAYLDYFIKAIWPYNMSVFYPHLGTNQPVWKVLCSTLFLMAIFLSALKTSKKYPYIFVGILWYIITLLPVIGLIQVGAQAMADRYTYIPLTGVFIVFSWGIYDFLLKSRNHRDKIFVLSSAIIILALIFISFNQVAYWKSSANLFKKAVNVTNNNWLAHNNLGAALFDKGKTDESIFHFKEALKNKPIYFSALYNLGRAFQEKGKSDTAAYYYNNVLRIKPKHEGVHNNLANLLFAQGRFDEAIIHYNIILKINPDNANAHNNLGRLLISQGNYKKAELHFNKALTINPEHPDALYNLGYLMIKNGKIKEGIAYLAKFFSVLDSTDKQKINSDYAEVYNNIGKILYENGKLKKARIFFSKAVQIDPSYKKARNNLLILEQMTQQDEKQH